MERGTGKLVPALSRKPELSEDLVWLWDAFWVLNHSREVGFGPGFIKLSEMLAYLTLFPADRPEFFIKAIQALDIVYLEAYNSKGKKPGTSGTATTTNTRKRHGRRGRA